MRYDFARTTARDLDLGSPLVSGAVAVSQFVIARLETLVGDWYRNTGYGLRLLWQKPASRATAELELRSLIRDVPGVIDVTSLTTTLVARSLRFAAELLVEGDDAPVVILAQQTSADDWAVQRVQVAGTIGGA